ncbi:MAG: DIP1984 family protein [Clostridia bacterium]|nr:DIP1984 family protein [Clostridia bacterium]
MKLAEALQERADLNRNISSLQDRIERIVLVQEGECPVEDPQELLHELNESISRLEYLIAAINHTNDQTVINGMTLTQMIARKDALSIKLGAYKDFVREAGRNTSRARGTEIKVIPTVKASELQKEIDLMSKEIRLLDNSLQETNWTRELME